MSEVLSLKAAPIGEPLAFVRVDGDPPLCRRLATLGFRNGAPISVVQKAAGGGRVIAVAGARIAIGAGVLKHIYAERSTAHG